MIEHAIFAAGCFWNVQVVFDKIPGVIETQVGYIGGFLPYPTYEQVCTNTTGHIEAVKLSYESQTVSYDYLLNVFFSCHDPTALNRQGVDIGSQYQSAIFYFNEKQKKQALNKIQELNTKKLFKNKIITKIHPLTEFFPAEEYHQKFLEKKGK